MRLSLCLMVVLAALTANAEDLPDAVKKLPPLRMKKETVGDLNVGGVGGLRVEGFTSGVALKVDADFAAANEHAPPAAPFVVTVPKEPEVLVLAGGKKTRAPELVKFSIATTDKQAIEILRFTDLSVPRQASAADRVKLCAYLLQTKGLAGAAKGYDKVKFLEAYATKIGGQDAACVHAHMTSPKSGAHYAVKLVGILHPSKDAGVMAFLMANTKLSEIQDPADLSSKGVGLRIIHSLKFL